MRSDSLRLSLLFTLLTALILAVFSTSLYFWVRDGLERSLTRELHAQARMVQEHFLEEYDEVARGIHPSIAQAMEEFLSQAEVAVEIRDSGGKVHYATQGYQPGQAKWREVELPTEVGGARFIIRAGLSLHPTEHSLRQLRLYFMVFSPALLFVAWVLGIVFVRRALAPVEEIRRQAERISRANVSERVPEPRSTGEFRDLARTINEMMGRLEGAIRDLDGFAADAAHELRTPLATLRAELETAIQGPLEHEEAQKVVESALEEVSRMSRIIDDLFALARVDLRQFAFRKERVQLRSLLEDTIETWGPSAELRRITLSLEGGTAEVPGDPVALRRVFMNLVENAVKYNQDGGRVTAALSLLQDRARICIQDNGLGIAPEHLPRLFKRFYRVDEARSRERGGAGLGLAITKAFIEGHGGTIRVESVAGQGTTFIVELPLENCPPLAAAAV